MPNNLYTVTLPPLPPGNYTYDMTTQAVYDASGERFGRVVQTFNLLGELRRQKKAPHKEIFYTWVNDPDPEQAVKRDEGKPSKKVLRAIVNCSNNQLTEAIRSCGQMIEAHQVNRSEGEQVLDLLYQELGKRANAGSP